MADGELVNIILLAMIAGFIILRLRAVLGERTGHEPDQEGQSMHRSPDQSTPHNRDIEEKINNTINVDFGRNLSATVRENLIDVCKIAPDFNVDNFMQGAGIAHQMILESFWAGNKEGYAPYTSDEIRQQFDDAIDMRAKDGVTLENKLVETIKQDIDEIYLSGTTGEITVKFVSQIIAITRDSNGEVVEGDESDTVRVTDLWTFAKDLKSDDPTWDLVATRAGN